MTYGENAFPHTGNNISIKNIGGKVGSYAISTVDFDSWVNEPVSQVPSRTRKTRGTKEIVNKIFTQCATVTGDPFWVDKFNNAAMGKLPPKFSFHNGILSYRRGARCNTLEVSNNPHEAASACVEFFRSNGGIFSPLDEQNSLELQYKRAHDVLTQEQLTWGGANKKVQECMLSYYVTDMKKLMQLRDSEGEQLRQTIRLGILNKYFGKNNIRVEHNRIHSIEGLLWNSDTRQFYMDPNLKLNRTRTYARKKDGPPAVDPSQRDTIPQFSVKWKKYVDHLDKKIIRNMRRQKRITVNQLGLNESQQQLQQLTTTTDATTDVISPTSETTDDFDDE